MMSFFRENLSLKLASLALAVGVWAYIRGEERPVQIFSVPLELQNLSPNLTVSGDVQDTVNVRVRAPESVLRNMGNETMLARVDLAGFGSGEQTVRVGRESVRVPTGVEVVRVTPEFLTLHLEKKVRRELPISPRVVGNPAPGYVLGESVVSPPETMVEGPESAVKEAREVDTETIRIDGRSQPFEAMVDLYPARPEVKVIGDGKAQVKVDIHERFVTRTLGDVAVTGEGAEMKVRLDPATVEVTLEGTAYDLAGLDAKSLAAVINLAEIPSGHKRARLEPRIVFEHSELEGKVFVRSVSPKTVTVHVVQGSSH